MSRSIGNVIAGAGLAALIAGWAALRFGGESYGVYALSAGVILGVIGLALILLGMIAPPPSST